MNSDDIIPATSQSRDGCLLVAFHGANLPLFNTGYPEPQPIFLDQNDVPGAILPHKTPEHLLNNDVIVLQIYTQGL